MGGKWEIGGERDLKKGDRALRERRVWVGVGWKYARMGMS